MNFFYNKSYKRHKYKKHKQKNERNVISWIEIYKIQKRDRHKVIHLISIWIRSTISTLTWLEE